MVTSFAAQRTLYFCRWPLSRLVQRFSGLTNGTNPIVATGGYGSTAKSPSQPRAFSFAERVAFQRAIEDVYWRHRIWPKENPDPKPVLDAVMSQTQLENKVTAYLHDSLVLDLAKVHHC